MSITFPDRSRPSPIAILVLVFALLAVFYSLIIPIFEGPDEDDHFRYARYISMQRALPVQLFQPGGGEAGHQGWQPPLYYTLASLVIAPIDTSDFSQRLWRNNAATFVGDPSCCGRNIYYHPDSEGFPFSGTTLAVHLARLLTVVFGAATVWAIYSLARRVLPEYPLGALSVAAVAAFNPSFLFSSALVSNDVPLAAFSSLTLLVLVKLLHGELLLNWKTGVVLGGLIGLGVLTKTTAAGLIPFAVIVLGLVGWRRRDWRGVLYTLVTLFLVIGTLTGWWFVRNWVLYGDPLAYNLMTTTALFPRSGPLTVSELTQISIPWLWQTFWGGPTPGDFAPSILVLMAGLAGLASVGVIVYLIRRKDFTHRASIILLMAWLVSILFAQLLFIRMTVGADQGRYLFPAIAGIAVLIVLGLVEIGTVVSFKLSSVISASLIGGAFALAVWVPFAYTLPAYARPALSSDAELARVPDRLQVRFGGRVELVGYETDKPSAKPGETVNVTLYWRAIAPMDESLRVFVHLVGQDNRTAGGADVIPARGAFPTVYWKPGDIIRDTVPIRVEARAVPGKYVLEVGLYPVEKIGARLEIDDTGDDQVTLKAIKIAPAQVVAVSPPLVANVNYGDRARLMGYAFNSESGSVALTLYWRSLKPFDRDYTVFVHAVDRNGEIAAQADGQPQGGNYPTTIWSPGEQVQDEYVLSLPPGTRPADFSYEIGMYFLETGERLPVADDRGNPLGDKLVIPWEGK